MPGMILCGPLTTSSTTLNIHTFTLHSTRACSELRVPPSFFLISNTALEAYSERWLSHAYWEDMATFSTQKLHSKRHSTATPLLSCSEHFISQAPIQRALNAVLMYSQTAEHPLEDNLHLSSNRFISSVNPEGANPFLLARGVCWNRPWKSRRECLMLVNNNFSPY